MVLHRRPTEATWTKQITIDLSAALTDEPLDLEGAYLAAFTVLELVGSASVTIGASPNALDLTEGQAREGFDSDGMTISTAGTPGGTVTLEIHGRF